MVDRINNSTGMLDALKYLQSSGQELSSAEKRMSSGLKVNSARDNVTAYHSAALMKAQGGSLSAVTLSLGRAESISDTAINAAEQVSKMLIEMKKTVVSAQGEDLTPAQRQAYANQFAQQKTQVETFIRNASFDDSNTLDGSKPNGVSFIADSDASVTLTLKGRNLLNGGGVILLDRNHDLSSVDNAQATKDALDQSITNLGIRTHRHGRRAQEDRGAEGFCRQARRCAGRRRGPAGRYRPCRRECADPGAAGQTAAKCAVRRHHQQRAAGAAVAVPGKLMRCGC